MTHDVLKAGVTPLLQSLFCFLDEAKDFLRGFCRHRLVSPERSQQGGCGYIRFQI
jgi:hypothetical protein